MAKRETEHSAGTQAVGFPLLTSTLARLGVLTAPAIVRIRIPEHL